MKTLKQSISRYMYKITLILVSIIFIFVLFIQILIEQKNATDTSIKVFQQIEQLLKENQKEINELQDEYKQTCLHNAEVVARIIESNPDVLNNINELKEIAISLEVDEIHIFDTTGRIFTGTHPEYYDYTFDSGEQMMFFKPMLTDKSLKLVQEITPNTAESKMMQYSARWSENGEFIVQIGMEPHNVMKVTQKNELSYIFSRFDVDPEMHYYAINSETTVVSGSTYLDCVGNSCKDIGLDFDEIKKDHNGFHCKVNGIYSYCVFAKVGNTYIGRTISVSELYQRIPFTLIILIICLVIVAFFLSNAVTKHMNRHVVNKINDINKKLELIARGNLNETIDIKSSVEFCELSKYINTMVKSILDNNRKMSYVLSKTNLYIGIYEYSNNSELVHFTEHTPKILSIDKEKTEQFAANKNIFKDFINDILKHSSQDEEGVYEIGEDSKKYIRLEEVNNDDEVFGVVIDITNDFIKRKKLEVERDMDSLTGLYNRRGFDLKLSNLMDTPKLFSNSAIIMIDTDDLKSINDTYGHEKGDIYLQKTAQILKNFANRNSIIARFGGDEFIILLYNFDNQGDLINTLIELKKIQDNSQVQLDAKISVPLKFSYGYSVITEISDYNNHLRDADRQMYLNKVKRKE